MDDAYSDTVIHRSFLAEKQQWLSSSSSSSSEDGSNETHHKQSFPKQHAGARTPAARSSRSKNAAKLSTAAALFNQNHKDSRHWQILVRFDQSQTFLVSLPRRLHPGNVVGVTDPHRIPTADTLGSEDTTQSYNDTSDTASSNESVDSPSLSLIQHTVSHRTGWPAHRLEVTHWTPPYAYANVRVIPAIRGGKGGFGTLLKGQSRQASAHTTTNFGACRDLHGRRLRHVNEAVQRQVWTTWTAKIEAGTATSHDLAAALAETPSGVAGWHLQLPAWAEVSAKKEAKRVQQLLRQQKRAGERREARAKQQRALIDRHVESYVQASETATEQLLEGTLATALAQGLARRKERKEQEQQQQRSAAEKETAATVMVASKACSDDDDDSKSDNDRDNGSRKKQKSHHEEPPSAWLTLSGDAVLANEEDEDGNDRWKLQSQTNFCTVAIVLDPAKREAALAAASSSSSLVLYWEAKVVTGGVVQLGWATPSMRPDSETGDGVGDCEHSWSVDGSRGIRLHGAGSSTSNEQPLPLAWQAGDVIGLSHHLRTHQFSCSHNGKDLGIVVFDGLPDHVVPALSCNAGEIVQLRVQEQEMDFLPAGATPVGDVVTTTTEKVTWDAFLTEAWTATNTPSTPPLSVNAPVAGAPPPPPPPTPTTPVTTAAVVTQPPIVLEDYDAVEALLALGLDRLKAALLAKGLKCGGTLEQRAARLWAVKGLAPEEYPPKLVASSRNKHIQQ